VVAYQRLPADTQGGLGLLETSVCCPLLMFSFVVYRIPITVPVGFADFPHELFPVPEPWIHNSFLDVVQYTEMPRGGHFAAFEEPEIFSNDVIQFVEKVEKRIAAKKQEQPLKQATSH